MKVKKDADFLEFIPKRNPEFVYEVEENDIVTIHVINKGIFNFIAQKVFKRPKISYIKFDRFGSFVWNQTDGESNIRTIGQFVKEEFHEEAEPLFERLSKFYGILYNYKYVV